MFSWALDFPEVPFYPVTVLSAQSEYPDLFISGGCLLTMPGG